MAHQTDIGIFSYLFISNETAGKRHVLLPSTRLTDPAGHASHSSIPCFQPLVPAGHSLQSASAVPPRKLRKLPIGHASQRKKGLFSPACLLN